MRAQPPRPQCVRVLGRARSDVLRAELAFAAGAERREVWS